MDTNTNTLRENVEIIKEFCSFMKEYLSLQSFPQVIFKHDKNNGSNPLGKTGFYSPEDKKVVIFITKRHLKDILRSLGHEMVHYKQDCEGRFNNASFQEGYAQSDGYLRKIEEEAYSVGSFLVRDFEDLKRRQK